MILNTVTTSVSVFVISDVLTCIGHNTQILLERSTKTDAIISRQCTEESEINLSKPTGYVTHQQV
jgi:hypothetical protein